MNIWDVALQILSIRPHSESELHSKLLAKGYTETEIKHTLAKARKYRFLDDAAFALDTTRRELAKLRGPLRIEKMLTQRGISPELAACALKTLGADDAQTQHQTARKALEKKFGKKSASQASRYRFLISQGFTEETARNVLQIEEDTG